MNKTLKDQYFTDYFSLCLPTVYRMKDLYLLLSYFEPNASLSIQPPHNIYMSCKNEVWQDPKGYKIFFKTPIFKNEQIDKLIVCIPVEKIPLLPDFKTNSEIIVDTLELHFKKTLQ